MTTRLYGEEIAEKADLEEFLERVDDFAHRPGERRDVDCRWSQVSEATYRAKVRDRVTLDDLKVLWAAFHDTTAAEAKAAAKIKERLKDNNLSDDVLALLVERQLEAVSEEGSELGFSLDPWVDLEKLQLLLSELLESDDELRIANFRRPFQEA